MADGWGSVRARRIIMNSLGERIRMVRGGESRHSFSGRLQISPATLQRYETGERDPDHFFLDRLIADKNLSRRWLLLGEGPMSMTDENEPQNGLVEENNNSKIDNVMGDLISALRENAALLRENGELKLEVERLKNQIAELQRGRSN